MYRVGLPMLRVTVFAAGGIEHKNCNHGSGYVLILYMLRYVKI